MELTEISTGEIRHWHLAEEEKTSSFERKSLKPQEDSIYSK